MAPAIPVVDLTLSSHKFRNTTISGPSGDIWYWIETDSAVWKEKPVSIYRASPKGTKDLMAVIEFHSISKTMITFNGETCELKQMFPKKHWYGSSRVMQTPIGECKWSNRNYKPTLIDPEESHLIKYSPNTHLFHKNEAPVLGVADTAMPFLDLVILGWVIEMHDIEEQRRAANASAAGAASSSAAAAAAGA